MQSHAGMPAEKYDPIPRIEIANFGRHPQNDGEERAIGERAIWIAERNINFRSKESKDLKDRHFFVLPAKASIQQPVPRLSAIKLFRDS
jgi:hypothetical protein